MTTRIEIALDQSFRHKDQDGRLHIKWTNISKATVNPYRGREIPGWETLGLDADRIYQLWRHPEELAKAASTFNGIQVMSSHLAVDAGGAMKEQVAGALGNDAEFRPPYLGNSMTIWWKEDIDDIESKEKCQLSCGYYYDPDMTPGEIQGERYDGIMRNIRANHVALVQAGRAGPDVLVHDSKDGYMNTAPLTSRKAILVKGAVTAFLRPKLMAGTILALDAAIAGVTRKNWQAEKPKVLAAVSALATPALAKDAKLDGLKEALDWMDDEEDGEAEDDEIEMDSEEGEESEEDREKRLASEKAARDKKARDAKAAKDKKARDSKTARDARRARDANPEDTPDIDPGTADEDETEAEMEARLAREKKANDKKAAQDKKAMDAAIDAATAGVVARMNALIKAREAVRPLVGNVSLALDSAEAVYKFALEAKKFPLNGIPPAAYEGLVAVLPRDTRPQPTIAQDAAATDDVFTRFPGMARIRLS